MQRNSFHKGKAVLNKKTLANAYLSFYLQESAFMIFQVLYFLAKGLTYVKNCFKSANV